MRWFDINYIGCTIGLEGTFKCYVIYDNRSINHEKNHVYFYKIIFNVINKGDEAVSSYIYKKC